MNNIDLLKQDETLKTIVTALVSEFPDCRITTDSKAFPLDDGYILVTLNGVDVESMLSCVRKVIPNYDLEDADNGQFTVFVSCNFGPDDDLDLSKLWRN